MRNFSLLLRRSKAETQRTQRTQRNTKSITELSRRQCQLTSQPILVRPTKRVLSYMNDSNLLGWLISVAIAVFLLRPVWRGFAAGLAGTDSEPTKSDSLRTFSTEVVGESHYQRNLESITGGKTPDGVEKYLEAELILEDANPHDKSAVRVDIQGKTVGYLSRERALQWRSSSSKLKTGKCSAVVRGGWNRGPNDQGHFGVWLKLP